MSGCIEKTKLQLKQEIANDPKLFLPSTMKSHHNFSLFPLPLHTLNPTPARAKRKLPKLKAFEPHILLPGYISRSESFVRV
jgi:hypothetical protein